MNYTTKDVKVFIGGQELKGCTVDEITFDSDDELRVELGRRRVRL